ncbi:MAG: F0F1 ATP synthase subunit A [Dehalococcoidia bacterium]
MGRTIAIVVAVLAVMFVGAFFIPAPKAPVVLPAERVFAIAGFPIFNTFIAAVLVTLFWLTLSLLATRNMRLIPTGLQNLVEMIVEFLVNSSEEVAGKKDGRRFFPFAATIFLFIITANWMSLVPGFLTVGEAIEHHGDLPYITMIQPVAGGPWIVPIGGRLADPVDDSHAVNPESAEKHVELAAESVAPGTPVKREFIPFLRGANTDLNMTIGLGLLAFLFIEYWGITSLGLVSYSSKFINFKEGPIGFFLGIIELITEFARIVSFGFRLFGNLFAGEVLLGVIVFLIPWIAVLPFMGLEFFVGFIQAAVFAMLVLVFGSTAVAEHGHSDDSHGEASHGEHATSQVAAAHH